MTTPSNEPLCNAREAPGYALGYFRGWSDAKAQRPYGGETPDALSEEEWRAFADALGIDDE